MENCFPYGEKEIAHLQKKDRKLGLAIERIGMIKRSVNPSVFPALVESIVGQQISSKAAATVCKRLREASGLDPERLDALTALEIQSLGMSMRKAGYIKAAAAHAVSGSIDFSGLSQKTDREVIEILTKIDGVGVWTAEMLLLFSLGRPDIVSFGDLAIRRGMMNLYGIKELTKERFMRYRKRYSPYGSVASLYLWELS